MYNIMKKYMFFIVLIIISVIIIIYCKIMYKKKYKYEYHCINMRKSKDRWEYIQHFCYTNNLKINRYNAYDGNKLNKKKLIHHKILHPYSNINPGQIGCAFSHVKLWEKCKKSNNDYFIILEDDVIINKDIDYHVNYIFNNAPNNWDIIFIGGCDIKGKHINKNFIIPTSYNNRHNLCTHAFILNKKKLDKMINFIKPIEYPIDNQLRINYENMNVYYYHKNIVTQNNNFESTISDVKDNDLILWKKNKQHLISVVD